jgi:ATP-dependent RNA helicase DeaD
MREAITSERLASFLPIVSQLSEEYDLRTIAAAALQMAYDQTVPAWQRNEHHSAEAEGSERGASLPKKRKTISVQSESREVSKAKE